MFFNIGICISFLIKISTHIGNWLYFVLKTCRSFSLKRSVVKEILKQCHDIGVSSIPIIIVTGAFTGIVLAFQSYYQLGVYGFTCAIGFFVVKSMLVEIGPVLIGLILSGRVGGAMSAFLGNMVITEQISAMKTMGVNPIEFFVFPRMIAAIITFPVLALLIFWSGVLSGFVLCKYIFYISSSTYWSMIWGNIFPLDLYIVLTKACVFGFLVASLSCFKGLNSNNVYSSLERVANKSVVTSFIAILFANCFITMIFSL